MNKKVSLLILFVIIGVVAISGCIDDDSPSTNDSSSSKDASSNATASGETGTLDDGTEVIIPEGFSKVEGAEGFTIATEDQNNVLVVTKGATVSPEEGKQNQIDNGAEFVSENTVNIAGIDVTLQQFTKQGFNLYGCLFNIGDDSFSVVQTSTAEEDITDSSNAANQIITYLAENSG